MIWGREQADLLIWLAATRGGPLSEVRLQKEAERLALQTHTAGEGVVPGKSCGYLMGRTLERDLQTKRLGVLSPALNEASSMVLI